MIAIEQLDAAVPVSSTRPSISGSSAVLPLWQLALSWVLLVPMLYIAANGTFVLHAGSADTAATGQTPGTDAYHKISVALVSLIIIALVSLRFSPVFALAQRVKLVLAFPVLAILSCGWSADPGQSIVSGAILMIFTVFAIYVASRFAFQRQLELVMFVGAVALPLSVGLAVFVPSIGATEAGWRGIFGHKQMCATASILWLVSALHWKCSGIYQKLFRGLCVALCIGLIGMSQSRTGWALALVALFLSGALWLLQKMPAKQALLIILLALPLVAAALCALYMISPSLLSSVGKDSTLSQRTIIWGAAWDAAIRHPLLGYGFSAFWKGLYGPSQNITLVAGWGLQQAQNGLLDVWLGMGLVGVACVLALTGQALRNALRCFFSASDHTYVRWCIVVIVCTLLYNIGESSIGLVNMNWLLFLLAAIGLTQSATSRYNSLPFGVEDNVRLSWEGQW